MTEIDVGSLGEFDDGIPKGWEGDGFSLVLIRRGNEVFALEDVCSHMEVPLSFGMMIDKYVLQCSAHGAQFDIRTGKNLSFPAVHPVKAYRTVLRDGRVLVIFEE